MRVKYLGIESIIIVNPREITIAASLMFDGVNYDQPVYTNIFCDYYQLKRWLNLDKSELGNEISATVSERFVKHNGENIQIDLPDFFEPKRTDWKFTAPVNLIKDTNDDIPFQCYRLQD